MRKANLEAALQAAAAIKQQALDAKALADAQVQQAITKQQALDAKRQEARSQYEEHVKVEVRNKALADAQAQQAAAP